MGIDPATLTDEEIGAILREYLGRSLRTLSPRRREIVFVIRDHRQVSFDFLARNFRGVPESSLHYDLRQLVASGIVRKLGSTRGAVYELSV